MKFIRKYGKASILIIVIAAILGLAVYGLFSLIKDFTNKEDSGKPFVSQNDDVSAKIPSGDNNAEKPDNNGQAASENKEISIIFNNNTLTITNAGDNYQFTNITGDNRLIVFLPDRTCEITGFHETEGSEMTDGFSISEESDGIIVKIDVNSPFTLTEYKNSDNLDIRIVKQKNFHVLEYRNDLSRIYMNIQKARLSSESDSFIKNYSETFDIESMTYSVVIPKKLMPVLKDETLVFNDGYFKTISISNVGTNIHMDFKVYEELIIYPNTRDYDAAFTFVKPKSSDKHLIVLDAGHGGIDGGAVSADKTIIEKHIVLEMCKLISNYLIDMGYDVINLREEDVFLGLMERTDIANLAKADAIVSVHINSYQIEHVNGVATLYMTSEGLATAIHESVLTLTGAKDMGKVRMTDLSILNRAEMEAIIIETGFITNEKEAKLLNTAGYQEKIAMGIALGIEKFYKGDDD